MSKIAHRWCCFVAVFALFLSGCSGSSPTPLPSATDTPIFLPVSSPTLTPEVEVEFLAFQSNREGNWEIYFRDRLGGPTLNLTNDPAEDRAPAFSPDGRYLAFESQRNGNWEIYIMELKSGEVRQVTNHPAYDGAPSWSPDGRYLAAADGDNTINLAEYSVVDFAIGIDGPRTKLKAKIDNLFNTAYYESVGSHPQTYVTMRYPMPGRTVSVGVEVGI